MADDLSVSSGENSSLVTLKDILKLVVLEPEKQKTKTGIRYS